MVTASSTSPSRTTTSRKPEAHRYGAHDIAADPRFVDPAANRFDLRADSPAVDSGTSGAIATIRGAAYSLPAGDLLGGARTGMHDRGAYELGARPADPRPATDPAPAPDPTPTPGPPAAGDPTPDPAAPADPAPTHGHAPRPKPTPPGLPAPTAPAPPRLDGVTVPPVVRPVSSARLRAALRACTRHGAPPVRGAAPRRSRDCSRPSASRSTAPRR